MPLPRLLPSAILAVSLALIGGAFYFEYGVGLEPCELCLAQRWPYYIAIIAAVIALMIGAQAMPWFAGFASLLFMIGAGLAAYHVAVEQHWIAGPDACTAGANGASTPEELLRSLSPVAVRCDQVQWSLFGISLAGFNLLASLALLAFTLWGLRRMIGFRHSAS